MIDAYVTLQLVLTVPFFLIWALDESDKLVFGRMFSMWVFWPILLPLVAIKYFLKEVKNIFGFSWKSFWSK